MEDVVVVVDVVVEVAEDDDEVVVEIVVCVQAVRLKKRTKRKIACFFIGKPLRT
jgi:hypothetical protein